MIWDVVHEADDLIGWAPIDHLAALAVGCLGGQSIALTNAHASRLSRIISLRPRRRTGERGLLAILRTPASVYALRRSAAFRASYGYVAVWIIDSFWDNLMPRDRAFADLDLVAFTRPNDAEIYQRLIGNRACLLAWGSDVLDHGTPGGERPVDVLRAGRQPPAWDDDAATTTACHAAGLRFAGRPPFAADPLGNQAAMMAAYATARYVIAHSNRAAPGPNTHSTKEYMTARWTDTLACGGIVAGVQPRSDRTMGAYLWPGATLDFDRIDLKHNIAALAEANLGWTPAQSRHNHAQALDRLDWRHRLRDLTAQTGSTPPGLQAELARLAARQTALAATT